MFFLFLFLINFKKIKKKKKTFRENCNLKKKNVQYNFHRFCKNQFFAGLK